MQGVDNPDQAPSISMMLVVITVSVFTAVQPYTTVSNKRAR
jgi:hypothetical protein